MKTNFEEFNENVETSKTYLYGDIPVIVLQIDKKRNRVEICKNISRLNGFWVGISELKPYTTHLQLPGLFEKNSEVGDWAIFAGLGGGFGGGNLVSIEKDITKEEAEGIAYNNAVLEYESFEGLHGLRDINEIMDDEECDESEAEMIRNEEMESWLDYYVEYYNPEKHDELM